MATAFLTWRLLLLLGMCCILLVRVVVLLRPPLTPPVPRLLTTIPVIIGVGHVGTTHGLLLGLGHGGWGCGRRGRRGCHSYLLLMLLAPHFGVRVHCHISFWGRCWHTELQVWLTTLIHLFSFYDTRLWNKGQLRIFDSLTTPVKLNHGVGLTRSCSFLWS